MNQAPTMVPTENPTLLCTPYGLLFNELQRSPEGIIQSMMELLQLALDLDIGTYKTPNADSKWKVDALFFFFRSKKVNSDMIFILKRRRKFSPSRVPLNFYTSELNFYWCFA